MFLETKKEGEARTKEPSMLSLIAWLETKNPAEEYDYYNCYGGCLLGQYFNAIGLAWGLNGGPGCELFNSMESYKLQDISRRHPRTFGGALERARVALSKAL